MESIPGQRSALSFQKGFTLLEFVIVVACIAILASILIKRVQFVTEKAHIAVFKSFSAAFQTAVRTVHGMWYMSGKPHSIKTVLMANGEIIGVTPTGWPVNGVFGTDEGSAQGCVEVWNAVLAKGSAMASINNREMFTASYEKPVCTYTLNARPGFRITYNIDTGGVATVTEVIFK